MLEKYMEDFADLGLVNFEMPLQTRKEVLAQIEKASDFLIPINKELNKRKSEKQALLNEVFYKMTGPLKTQREKLWGMFELAGDISYWESKNRQIWTRAHREVKLIMEQIGKDAAKKGIITRPEDIYKKPIPEVIKIAKKLG